MTLTILHTADWHIGKSFGRFEPDRAVVLRRVRLEAIDRLAAAARAAGARLILVAGDIFDSSGLPDRDLLEAMARIARLDDLTWHLLPGNHDPAGERSVWTRLARHGLPANVLVHTTAAPCSLSDDAVLLPAPLHSRATANDPTGWMDAAASPQGMVRIGLAHGSVQGFGSAGDAAVPISPRRAVSAGLDYLALGDWHGTKEVATGVWYSGTPEPDQFADNSQGHALIVELEATGAPARVRRVPTGHMRWASHVLDGDILAALRDLDREARRPDAKADSWIWQLRLRGRVRLAEDAEIAALLARLDPCLFNLEVDRDGLLIETGTEAGIDGGGPEVARIVKRLAARGDDPVALLALRRLAAAVRDVEGGTRT